MSRFIVASRVLNMLGPTASGDVTETGAQFSGLVSISFSFSKRQCESGESEP